MAKFEVGGTPYSGPLEVWEPTMHLAFFTLDVRDGGTGTRKTLLHQQWRSNIGGMWHFPYPGNRMKNQLHNLGVQPHTRRVDHFFLGDLDGGFGGCFATPAGAWHRTESCSAARPSPSCIRRACSLTSAAASVSSPFWPHRRKREPWMNSSSRR